MNRDPEEALLDSLAQGLGRQAPPAIDPEVRARMIARAVSEAQAAKSAPKRARVLPIAVLAGGLAAAAAFAIGIEMGSSRVSAPMAQPSRTEPLLRFTTPAGDGVVSDASARFDLRSATAAERHFDLQEGAMLFEVVPLKRGERFEVSTPHLIARVRGTVFSVRVTETATRVDVYEGKVALTVQGEEHLLGAGASFDTAGAGRAAPTDGIDREGRGRAARRGPVSAPVADSVAVPALVRDPGAASAPVADPVSVAVRDPGAVSAPSLPEVTRLLSSGNARRAFDVAHTQCASSSTDGRWCLLAGDAARSLGHFQEAVAAFDDASSRIDGADGRNAGYLAAWVRHHHLSDSAGALESLDRSRADATGSPVEELALALRVHALVALARSADARPFAERYLLRFPAGRDAAWMTRALERLR